LELGSDARVLDLAAGTGRLTAELRRRFAKVVAVEPDERMRAVHGEALAGSAEAIPLEDASMDAVFVGEAFHWFDPAAAIPELARGAAVRRRPRGRVHALVGDRATAARRGAAAAQRALGALAAAAAAAVGRCVRRGRPSNRSDTSAMTTS
jgi:SAM-dependent methyltransferase